MKNLIIRSYHILRYLQIARNNNQYHEKTNVDNIMLFLESEKDIYEQEIGVSPRSIHRSIAYLTKDIELPIKYDKGGEQYFIKYDSSFKEKEARLNLLYHNMTNLFVRDSSSEVDILYAKQNTNGIKHFISLNKAIKNRTVIRLSYQKYWQSSADTFEVEPYALKEFNYCWYLLAKREGKFRIYAVDRMKLASAMNKTFERDKSFKAKDYFKDMFGIIREKGPAEEITFRAETYKANYIRNKPFHNSQKEIFENDEYVTFQICVKVSFDLMQEFLKHSPEVQIISPNYVKNRHIDLLNQAIENYQKL